MWYHLAVYVCDWGYSSFVNTVCTHTCIHRIKWKWAGWAVRGGSLPLTGSPFLYLAHWPVASLLVLSAQRLWTTTRSHFRLAVFNGRQWGYKALGERWWRSNEKPYSTTGGSWFLYLMLIWTHTHKLFSAQPPSQLNTTLSFAFPVCICSCYLNPPAYLLALAAFVLQSKPLHWTCLLICVWILFPVASHLTQEAQMQGDTSDHPLCYVWWATEGSRPAYAVKCHTINHLKPLFSWPQIHHKQYINQHILSFPLCIVSFPLKDSAREHHLTWHLPGGSAPLQCQQPVQHHLSSWRLSEKTFPGCQDGRCWLC